MDLKLEKKYIEEIDAKVRELELEKVRLEQQKIYAETAIAETLNKMKELGYTPDTIGEGISKMESDIKTLKSKDTKTFEIKLPDNLYIPKEANQIEIQVVEGVSDSYYINIIDDMRLNESKFLFTFNALSDIHIQNKNASAIYNSHLKMALRDIYSSDSEAIFVAGDIINMSAVKTAINFFIFSLLALKLSIFHYNTYFMICN